MTLAPKALHFGSDFGAFFVLGCKSENLALFEMGTLLRPSGQTLLGVIMAHCFRTPQKSQN